MNKINTSVHHIIAKDHWGSEHNENKIRLEHELHLIIHYLFQNLPPHEIIKILVWNLWKVFKKDVQNQIMNILDVDKPSDLYKDHCIRNHKAFNYKLIKHNEI